jgi:hypothetical protein
MRILSTVSTEDQTEKTVHHSKHVLVRAKTSMDLTNALPRPELVMADFLPMMQDIVQTYPGCEN